MCTVESTLHSTFDESTVLTPTREDLDNTIDCILLPYLQKSRDFETEYAIVFHDWGVINHLGDKDISSFCDQLFSTDVMALNC